MRSSGSATALFYIPSIEANYIERVCLPVQGATIVLKAFYTALWHVELNVHYIKTTLGMEVLSCHIPDRIEKDIWTCVLATNLRRILTSGTESD